ncbi:MAG: helix-turn-helix domain-containing protein [bacterium]
MAQLEKELSMGALKETHWVQTKAAKLLGISRPIIKYKMEKYGIMRN